MIQTTKQPKVAKQAPSKVGKRVMITLEGHKYNNSTALITSESKTNYTVKIVGKNTPVKVAKNGAKVIGGRRPRVA